MGNPIKPDSEVKLRAVSLPCESLVFPSDCLSIPLPSDVSANYVSIIPTFPEAFENNHWSPQVCEVFNGKALFVNNSSQPILAAKYTHFRPNAVTVTDLLDSDNTDTKDQIRPSLSSVSIKKVPCPKENMNTYLSEITVNTSLLSSSQLQRINSINYLSTKSLTVTSQKVTTIPLVASLLTLHSAANHLQLECLSHNSIRNAVICNKQSATS